MLGTLTELRDPNPERMTAWPVSKDVWQVKNQGEQLIEPQRAT